MQITEIPVGDIKIKLRLRNPSEEKVKEISSSISQIGLISPVVIDSNFNLIAGFHRLLAFKKLKKDTIPAIVKDVSNTVQELIEVDENASRNSLTHIEYADHLVKREKLLQELGLMHVANTNPYERGNKLKVSEVAESLGLS